MKKIILLLALILSTSFLYASFFDTGYVKWKQPNDVEFTARLWGDEFESQMETNDGYRIKIGVDNYYYYAELDTNGDYKPSTYKVGIDAPLYSSYHLERSSQWNTTLQARIDAFNAQLELNHQAYLDKMASGDSTYKFGIVLIDFTPSEKHLPNAYPLGYYSSFYDSLIFSTNYYWFDTIPGPPIIHPEDLNIFGSFADYYDDQSNGKIKFVGRDGERKIVNPDTMIGGIGYPKWVVMDSTKGYYGQIGIWPPLGLFLAEAEAQLGINLDTVYEKIAFIYAGDGSLGGVTYMSGNAYMVSETGEDEVWGIFFANIGGHCHEFGHDLGLGHIGVTQFGADTLGFHWNLMGFSSMGPRYRGACPASLAPYHLVERLHWAEYDTLLSDTTITIQYETSSPRFYYCKSRYGNTHFVMENRLHSGFDLWTPHNEILSLPADPDSIDPNHNIGGLLIWRNGVNLMVADAAASSSRQSARFQDTVKRSLQRDAFPFNRQDGLRSGLDFNDHTVPGSNLLNGNALSGGSYSHIAINDITWNPSDSSTTVSISLNNDIEIITSNTTWSGIHTVQRDIYVDSGAKLTISPGTSVFFDSHAGERFSIAIAEGCTLDAAGTPNSPIIFRSSSGSGNWDGILMEEGSTLVFHNAVVKHATVGLTITNSNYNFSHCNFDSCETGMILQNCSSDLQNMSFSRCGKAVLAASCSLNILSTTFTQCTEAVNAMFCSASVQSSEVSHCLTTSFNTCVLSLSSSTVTHSQILMSGMDSTSVVTACVFDDSSQLWLSNKVGIILNRFIGSGMRIGDSAPTLLNNVFLSMDSGRANTLAYTPGATPRILGNLFVGYEFGIYCEGRTRNPLA